MEILEKVKLSAETTFKIGGEADFFVTITSTDELKEAVRWAQSQTLPILVLGGGSNMLISDDGWRGLVIKMSIQGEDILEKTEDTVLVRVSAGEHWDTVVGLFVERGWYGAENLSLIPGTVGAVPIQNIGAYGIEAQDIVERVEVLNMETGEREEFDNNACQFGYRNSFFKTLEGKKFIVTAVVFRLSLHGELNLSYNGIKDELAKMQVEPTLSTVRQAIITIRRHKLPDPSELGTAGSFFVNPIISREQFVDLAGRYPDIPSYDLTDGRVKIPLGWVIDHICQMKGITLGKVGTYDKQALVLINYGGATAADVLQMEEKIKACVFTKTGLKVESEVNHIGF